MEVFQAPSCNLMSLGKSSLLSVKTFFFFLLPASLSHGNQYMRMELGVLALIGSGNRKMIERSVWISYPLAK